MAFLQGLMDRERPQARGGMAVHIPTIAVPYEACRIGGSLPATATSARPSRPPPRLRHKRNDASDLQNLQCVPSERGSRAHRP